MKFTLVILVLFFELTLNGQEKAIIASNFPDPTVIFADGKYYAYATNSGSEKNFRNIQVAVSENLKEWKLMGDALPAKPVWGHHDFWAPHVLYNEVLKKYVLFYSAETTDTAWGKAIGVAFSSKPEGPFIDSGAPLIKGKGFTSIDPMVIKDPGTKKYFITWGSGFQPIKIRELDPSMVSFAKGSKEINIIPVGKDIQYSRLIEGAWIDYANGYYYLYYSGDNCCGKEANYAVMVARAKNIEGPYTRLGAFNKTQNSTILEKDAALVAPGHNSVIKDKNGNRWIAYHAIPAEAFSKGHYNRIMYMSRLEYKNGWPVITKNESPRSQIIWEDSVTISSGSKADKHGKPLPNYGGQYPRLLQLGKNIWLAAYTVLNNMGYKKDPTGGLQLEISKSIDNGKTWKKISTISDPGRDLDNAQMIQLPDGSILLAGRSVRWQESYQLPVYKSTDQGRNWKLLSVIDENKGAPGTLGKPDKGIYEPHFYFLKDGRLSVFYANEKHVTETPSYSQIISQKISTDLGKTWGKEIWVAYQPGHPLSRPGMPVIDRMKNRNYIIVYEVCGPEDCTIYYKTSTDGCSWAPGLGTLIPDQKAAPYILALEDGRLVITSNLGAVSVSEDYGGSWELQDAPWLHSVSFDKDWHQTIWQSIYQFSKNKIGVVTSRKRKDGGHDIKIRFGNVVKLN